MAASREDISKWFDRGMKKGASHMAIICDTFDWDDYPKYFMPGEELPARDKPMGNMQIYCLSCPRIGVCSRFGCLKTSETARIMDRKCTEAEEHFLNGPSATSHVTG
jgi:hypothetical protein